MIGIGITERDRYEVFKTSYDQILKYMPKGAKLVVVDDASSKPFQEATFRFENNVGIATAKNKCIELLSGCEHIFLFDSDTYPKKKNWHIPYIKSKEKHLSFTFDRLSSGKPNGRQLKGNKDGINIYGSPCGCMLYIHNSVFEKIGGFDVDYPQWGFEHVDFSQRAYNAGLTSHPFMDVENSLDLFHSMDYYSNVGSSVSVSDKANVLKENRDRYSKRIKSDEKMPIRNQYEGILLAAYITGKPDPQRGIEWSDHKKELHPLIQSCKENGLKHKIFISECSQEFSPNVYRWFLYYEWLKKNPVEFVWMVDSTDVEVLKNPLMSVNPNKLYLGNEFNMKVDNLWMRKNQEPHLSSIKDYRKLISSKRKNTIPNCGIVGGGYDIVMEFLDKLTSYHLAHTRGVEKSTDMAVFNYTVWKHFEDAMTTGIKVNTRFKKFETNNISFFRHK